MKVLRFLLVAIAIAPGAALAQTKGPDTPAAESSSGDEERKRAEAKERFLKGLTLANGGDWDAALVEFQASIDIFPTRVAMMNAAVSLRNLKRYAEAAD